MHKNILPTSDFFQDCR